MQTKWKKDEFKKAFLYTAVYFLISVLIRGCLGDFPKKMVVYPDEVRYLEIARNLFHGRGLMIHQTPVSFQKILYPVVLMPAFLFPDADMQIRAIGWINSIVIAGAVFPAYVLAKKALKKEWMVHAVLLALVTSPAMISSMYFMSEVLFLPLSLWIVYLVYTVIQQDDFRTRVRLNICLGIVLYAAYLNKEIALYYLLAYLIVRLGFLLLYREERARESVCLGSMLAAFLGCFLLMKLTLFAGMGNSYDQMGLAGLLSLKKIVYLIYGFLYDFIFAVLGLGVFTVLIPAASISRGQDDRRRQYLCFLIFALLTGCAAIAYTITVREDFPLRSPRQHLRYLEPLCIPFLIAALSVAGKDGQPDRDTCRKTGILLCLYGVAFISIAYGIGPGPWVDQSSLRYFVSLFQRFALHHFMEISVEWQALLCRELFVAVWLLMYWLLCRHSKHKKHKKQFWAVFLCLMAALNLANNVLAYRAVQEYAVAGDTAKEMTKVNKLLSSVQGKVLLISENCADDTQRLFDTYADSDALYRTSLDLLYGAGLLEDGVICLDNEYTQDIMVVNWELDQADWILAPDTIAFRKDSVRIMEDFPLTNYHMYQNLDNKKVCLQISETAENGTGS